MYQSTSINLKEKKTKEIIDDKNLDDKNLEENEMTMEEIHSLQDAEFEKIYNSLFSFEKYISKISSYIYGPIIFILRLTGIYFVWITLHYAASHVYVQYCVPGTIFGFLISPFLVTTPHCQALRWLISTAADTITKMWLFIGAWICSNILMANVNNGATKNE